MKIKVITNAKKQEIKKQGDLLKVYLISKPEKGKANNELINLLTDYFKTSKSNINIRKGEKSKNKIMLSIT
ncbi:DUF167 domain-containing protein [Patescibacteria group bacterium]|nr:DUF167 domain-containing protein [Patescibacteria group bacterium]